MQELGSFRNKIRDLTFKILELIHERNNVALNIAELKQRHGLNIENEEIEIKLEDDVVSFCEEKGINEELALKVLHSLLEESKRLQGYTKQSVVTPMTVASRAMSLASAAKNVIRLDIGEPDFPPPNSVVEECSRAMKERKTHYTDSRGIPQLREALQQYLMTKYKFSCNKENLLITPGGRFAIFAAFSSIVKEGQSVLLIEPNWPAYKENLEFAGIRPIVIKTSIEDNWDVDLEKIKESIRKTTRAIVISYPSNPTGKIIRREDFKAILEIARDYNLYVVSDEIYNEYAYADCPSILQYDVGKFILTSSFSKTWAMTGFRIGYAVSDKDVISKMQKVLSLIVTCVPEFIQYGAIKALQAEEEVRRNTSIMKRRIELAYNEIRKIDSLITYKPDGGMYLFPVSNREDFDSSRFASELLEKRFVAVSPGCGFGDYPRAFRISLGQNEEKIIQGIRTISEMLG